MPRDRHRYFAPSAPKSQTVYIVETTEEVRQSPPEWLWTYNNECPSMRIGCIIPAENGRSMKLRGVSLLAAVFGELQELVPEGTISTEELLSAAQSLIELSRNEYITKPEREATLSSGYFSRELTLAFEKYQMQILRNEYNIQFDNEITVEGRQRLKEIMMGENSDMYLGIFNA